MTSLVLESLRRHCADAERRRARRRQPASPARRIAGSEVAERHLRDCPLASEQARRDHRPSPASVTDPDAGAIAARDMSGILNGSFGASIPGSELRAISPMIGRLAGPLLAASLVVLMGQSLAASEAAQGDGARNASRAVPIYRIGAPTRLRSLAARAEAVRYVVPQSAAPRIPRPDETGHTQVRASTLTAAAIDAANRIRAERGLHPLRHSLLLDRAAERHTLWMTRTGRFSHVGRAGSRAQQRIGATGYRACYGGENLAKGTPSLGVTLREWMRSPGHRRILLTSRGAEMGFAMARDAKGRPHWTMLVGTPCA